MRMLNCGAWTCHGISIIVRKPITFVNGMVETTMEESTNLSVVSKAVAGAWWFGVYGM